MTNRRMPNDLLRQEFWEQEAITVERVSGAINNGADPNARGYEGWTPLHFAAALCKNVDKVERLLKHGVEVDARENQGRTPLHVAAAHSQNPDVVELAKAKDADGKIPADYADENKALAGSNAYWRLNAARYE